MAPGAFRPENKAEIKVSFYLETAEGNACCLFARPERITVTGAGDGDLIGIVTDASTLGPVTRYVVAVNK